MAPAQPPGESQCQLGPSGEVSPAPTAAGQSSRPESQSWGRAKAESGEEEEEEEEHKPAPGPVLCSRGGGGPVAGGVRS